MSIVKTFKFVSHHYPKLLLVYFILLSVVRLLSRPVLEVDEAEQIYLAQWWFFGYGQQPPLFSWLQHVFLLLIGDPLIAVSSLKGCIYFIIFYFAYKSAMHYMHKDQAVASNLLMFFILPISIHSFRHTHTILAMAMASIAFFLWSKWSKNPNIKFSLLLGLTFGLGLLAKYNFLLVITGLVILTLYSKTLKNKKSILHILLIGFSSILIFSVHGYWLLQNLEQVHNSVSKDLKPENLTYLASILKGTFELSAVLLNFVVLVFLILLWAYRARLFRVLAKVNLKNNPPLRFSFINLLLVLLLVLSGQMSEVHGRWVEPLLFLFPVGLFIALEEQEMKLSHRLIRPLVVIAPLILLFHSLRYPIESAIGMKNRTHCDFTEIYQTLNDYPNHRLVGENYFISGNLKMLYPKNKIYCLEGKSFMKQGKDDLLITMKHPNDQPEKLQSLHSESSCFQLYPLQDYLKSEK